MGSGPKTPPPDIGRLRKYRWLLVSAIFVTFVLLFLMLMQPRTSAPGIAVSLIGYTNEYVIRGGDPKTNYARFALFSLLNKDSVPIRWRGDWVEIEGPPRNLSEVMTPDRWSSSALLKPEDPLK